jgi:iron complex transport system ATP-binding protein
LANEGKTILAAVHDLNVASTFTDQAILLRDGRLGLFAPTQEVLASRQLDELYGVEFERVKTQDGAVRVFPRV